MALAGRSEQHPFEQAICASPTRHGRLAASQYRYADHHDHKAAVIALRAFCAVAFSRTGDPATGDFRDAQVIKKFGDVPDDLSTL